MATRRIISTEKTILDRDDPPTPTDHHQQQSSSTAPAVPTDVILKLLAFTLAMIVVPIGSYFATVNTVFKGNSTYAGGLAALMANVVLVGYVIVAMNEDQSDQQQQQQKRPSPGTPGKPDTKKER